MRQPHCPRCRSTALTLFAKGVLEWDGEHWVSTGELRGRRWLNCTDCGHTWATRCDPYNLAIAMRGQG